jgi:hypothetical protein
LSAKIYMTILAHQCVCLLGRLSSGQLGTFSSWVTFSNLINAE